MKFLISTIVVLAAFGAIAALNSTEELFREFIEKYDRHYKTMEEHRLRYGIFVNNLQKIKQMQETEVGTAIYGINKFADKTPEELHPSTGLHRGVPQVKFNVSKPSPWPLQGIPVNFDWRQHNAVTDVKNEGESLASYVFSAIANIEGLFAIKHGLLFSFSVQELLDCTFLIFPDSVYDNIVDVGGLEIEADYPFVDIVDQTCQFDQSKNIAQLSGSIELPSNETELAQWLFENGPINVFANAVLFGPYKSGIINNKNCPGGDTNLNHGVTLVGYGRDEKGGDYWIAKNSWGADWGEQGYVRLARGNDMCGVADLATSAIVV